jgi:hypothetical protein
MLDPDSYTLLASKGGRVVYKKFTGNSSEIGQVINISLYVYVMMFIDVWGKVLVLAYLILNMLLDIRLKIYFFSAGRSVDALAHSLPLAESLFVREVLILRFLSLSLDRKNFFEVFSYLLSNLHLGSICLPLNVLLYYFDLVII